MVRADQIELHQVLVDLIKNVLIVEKKFFQLQLDVENVKQNIE